MIRRIAVLCLVVAAAVSPSSGVGTAAQTVSRAARLPEHVAWVIESLKQMGTIKAGMTRADLLKVFTTEGGIQTGRTFVFRDCPYFKVTVDWEPTGRAPAGSTLAERAAFIDGLPGDVIKAISRPYIQGMIID